MQFLRERRSRRLRRGWAPEFYIEPHLFNLSTMIRWPARGSLHPGSNILQRLVRKVHANRAEARMIEIENDIDRHRHNEGKPGPMEVHAERLAVSQAVSAGNEQNSAKRSSAPMIIGGVCVLDATALVVAMSIVVPVMFYRPQYPTSECALHKFVPFRYSKPLLRTSDRRSL